MSESFPGSNSVGVHVKAAQNSRQPSMHMLRVYFMYMRVHGIGVIPGCKFLLVLML
jgi:hypothetical protein